MTAWLSDAARRALEELMSLHGYEFQSEFAKKYFGEGHKEAFKKAFEEGFKEGLLMAIEGLTDVLGIALSAEQRETLEKADVERLETIFQALRSSKQWPGA